MADGTMVHWRWLTDSNDVIFSAEFSPDGEVDVAHPVVPEAKAVTHKGFFEATVPGVLEFRFSNAHSSFTKKVVHLRVASGLTKQECLVRGLQLFSRPKGYGVDGVSK